MLGVPHVSHHLPPSPTTQRCHSTILETHIETSKMHRSVWRLCSPTSNTVFPPAGQIPSKLVNILHDGSPPRLLPSHTPQRSHSRILETHIETSKTHHSVWRLCSPTSNTVFPPAGQIPSKLVNILHAGSPPRLPPSPTPQRSHSRILETHIETSKLHRSVWRLCSPTSNTNFFA